MAALCREIYSAVEVGLWVAALLVGSDLRFVLQRQTDVVEPFEQHGLAEMIDFEREVQSLRVASRFDSGGRR